MSWDQFQRARLLLAEEAVGVTSRAEAMAEEAKVARTRDAIRAAMPKPQHVNGATPAVIQPRPITDEIVGV